MGCSVAYNPPPPPDSTLTLKKICCWWNINISARANPFKCTCRIWGRGRGCRLHCSPHNLSVSVISSLGIIIAQKKCNRRETNRNKKPTNQQITTTTKAKKEEPPPPEHEACPSHHPLRHLGGKFHICAFLWRSLQVWSLLWFQAGLEV